MSSSVVFTLDRTDYRGLFTIGELRKPTSELLSYTLEDCVRAYGIKDAKRTAIPANDNITLYRLSLSYSNRFKRILPIMFTETDMVTIKAGGISFQGCRMHGANNDEDVEGCVGVAKQRIDPAKLQQLAESTKGDLMTDWVIRDQNVDEVVAAIKYYEDQGIACYLKINNRPQAQ